MNIGFGIATLLFIFISAVFIFMKHKTIRSILWNLVLLLAAGASYWIGHAAKPVWVILLTSMIIGGCLLMSAVHAYNKLFATGKGYDSVGETRKPRSFGNGYWR